MNEPQVGDVIEEGPWAGFTLISRYTRAQAIEDGVLVDVGELAREAGFRVPVALTAAVAALVEPSDAEQAEGQDRIGRLWDVLSIVRWRIRALRDRDAGDETELRFGVFFRMQREGYRPGMRNVPLKLVSGPGDEGEHVLTVMLPDED